MRKLLLLGLVGCGSASKPPPHQPIETSSVEDERDNPCPEGSRPFGALRDAVYCTDDGAGTSSPNAAAVNHRAPIVTNGPTIDGAADKPIIRKHIKLKVLEIKSCYEQALTVTPTLEGTVTVLFTIGADGRVIKSEGSGIPVLNACIAAVVQQIVFPKPVTGGVVTVRYPFVFASSDPALSTDAP